MFGQYKRLTNRYEADVLTGKGLAYGGSRARKEATGFGATYFVERMLARRGDGLEGKRAVVSGAGNVAIYTSTPRRRRVPTLSKAARSGMCRVRSQCLRRRRTNSRAGTPTR
jgi:hypothetical protein